MTLTLQSVSSNMLYPNPAKIQVGEKIKTDFSNHHQQPSSLSYESNSPILQDHPEMDHNNNNISSPIHALEVHKSSTALPRQEQEEESVEMTNHPHYGGISPYDYHHQTYHSSSYNHHITHHHLSPFHPPILNSAFLKSSKENYINPIFWKDTKFQQIILPIECGRNQALMFLSKLCQGSKGPCILFKNAYWLTPNEFQFISGRETAKDWKRSIRHNGKSIKLLINKGILCVHSPLCECGTGTASSIKMGQFSFDQHHHQQSQIVETGNYISGFHEEDIKDEIKGHCSSSSSSPDDGQFYKRELGARWNKQAATVSSPSNSRSRGETSSENCEETDVSSGSSPEWNFGSRRIITTTNSTHSNFINRKGSSPDQYGGGEERGDELILSVSVSRDEGGSSPQSIRSSDEASSSISTLTAAESQSEETSITGSATNMNNNNNNNDSPTPPPKVKRRAKSIAVKSERQSPQLSSSTTSPPMTPPPPSNTSTGQNISGGGSGSSPPPAPIKQMEQMMGSGRNYSDFMRSLAAKYNQQSPNIGSDYYSRTSPANNFAFDTRFLKPAAAAALLNLSCSQIPSSLFGGGGDKEKFPMIDMSSTQSLLSMVRSASAVAANNLESNLKASSGSSSSHQNHKRPNSPLDLSSRDMPSTPPPPPLKKSKLRNPLLDGTLNLKPASNATPAPTNTSTTTTPCLSSCSTGCSEEAQIMINWSVEEVCRFVSNIDLCKDYVEVFREHAIDGSSLPLLTEEHLMNAMNMKLGPALKFRSTIARKLGNCVVCSHCTHCHNHNNNINSNNSP